jgi:hypothetical protein
MASFPRLILPFAATCGIAALLLTAAPPAMAAESAVTTRETAAKPAPSTIKRHASKRHASRLRFSASHYHRRVNSIRSDLGCSGDWCGRQFVLMIGVGY